MSKKILTICFLVLTILILFMNQCFAAISVNKENLTQSFKNYEEMSNKEEDPYVFNVTDDTITVIHDGDTFEFKYDLSGDPEFFIEIPISKGISYEKYKEETGKVTVLLLGYIATLNVQNIDFKDGTAYAGMVLIDEMMNAISNNQSTEYIIIEDGDTAAYDGVTAIKESEFGEHVMEYVSSIYGTKTTYADNKSGQYNTFTWTTEKIDVTEDSCKIVSTLRVNMGADFSKLNGYAESLEDDNENNEVIIGTTGTTTTTTTTTTNTVTTMPRTGEETDIYIVALYVVIAVSAFGILALIITKRK